MNKRSLFSAIVALGMFFSVNSQIVIEAESFGMTSGTYEGFQTYQVAGASGGAAINWNQTGDYAMYQLPGFQSGQYVVTYYISTPMDGAAVEFSVMSPSYEEAVVTQVPNNGSWDGFQQLVSEPINIISGNVYSVIIKSVGNTVGDWEWNLDKVELTRVGDLSFPLESIYTLSDNPVTIDEGEIIYLEVGTTPTLATNQNMTWTSSDESVVTVPSIGNILTTGGGSIPVIPMGKVENYITGMSEGNATITVTSEEGNFVTSFDIEVISPASLVLEVEDEISYNSSMGVPQTTPDGGTALEISSNKTGLFTFLISNNYVSYSRLRNSGMYNIEFLVKTNNSNTTISLHTSQPEVWGETMETYEVSLPNTNGVYEWVSIEEVAGFENGRNNYNFSISVEGTDAVLCTFDKIKFTKVGILDIPATGLFSQEDSVINLRVGERRMDLIAEFSPLYATNQNVTWTSSNPAVVEVGEGYIYTYGGGSAPVTQSGMVKNDLHALSVGTAIVTATSEDGNFVASFNVNVNYSFVIEAENESSPYSKMGEPEQYNDGVIVVENGASGIFSFNIFNPGVTYNLFANQSGEYTVEFLVRNAAPNAKFTLENMASSGDTGSYEVELPTTTQLTWVALGETINFEYGRNASMFSIGASSYDSTVCSFDKVRFTRIGDLNEPALGLVPKTVTNFTLDVDAWEMAVGVVFTPSHATNQNVTWVSSNSAVVEVSPTGRIVTNGGGSVPFITTGVVENDFHAVAPGAATITATSEDGNYSVVFNITVDGDSLPVIFEAEDYAQTGGTYAGFQTYQLAGASNGEAINWNQTGDWATYLIPAEMESGVYVIDYYISTSMNGSQVELSVDGVSQISDAVVNNGSWDSFQKLTASQTVEIDVLTNSEIKIASIGSAGAWQWNMDYFVMTKVGEINSQKSATLSITGEGMEEGEFSIYPTNVVSEVNIEFSLCEDTDVTIDIIDMSGQVKASVINDEVFSEGSNKVTVGTEGLTSGIYLVRVVAGNEIKIGKIIK